MSRIVGCIYFVACIFPPSLCASLLFFHPALFSSDVAQGWHRGFVRGAERGWFSRSCLWARFGHRPQNPLARLWLRTGLLLRRTREADWQFWPRHCSPLDVKSLWGLWKLPQLYLRTDIFCWTCIFVAVVWLRGLGWERCCSHEMDEIGEDHMNSKGRLLRWLSSLGVSTHGIALPCDQSLLWWSGHLVFKIILRFHSIVLTAAVSLVTLLETYRLCPRCLWYRRKGRYPLKPQPTPNLLFKISQARPGVCSSMKHDTQPHLTNAWALGSVLLVLGMAVRLQLLGGDRGGIGVPVAWPLCRFYNECFSNPVPLIHVIFRILEICGLFFFPVVYLCSVKLRNK